VLRYDVAAYVRELTPDGSMFRIDDRATFEPLYRAKLDRIGPARIEAILRWLIESHNAGGCVLLCFEDLRGESWCHREIAADWLEENLATEVRELGAEGINPGTLDEEGGVNE
jgi:hypothetical protein